MHAPLICSSHHCHTPVVLVGYLKVMESKPSGDLLKEVIIIYILMLFECIFFVHLRPKKMKDLFALLAPKSGGLVGQSGCRRNAIPFIRVCILGHAKPQN